MDPITKLALIKQTWANNQNQPVCATLTEIGALFFSSPACFCKCSCLDHHLLVNTRASGGFPTGFGVGDANEPRAVIFVGVFARRTSLFFAAVQWLWSLDTLDQRLEWPLAMRVRPETCSACSKCRAAGPLAGLSSGTSTRLACHGTGEDRPIKRTIFGVFGKLIFRERKTP